MSMASRVAQELSLTSSKVSYQIRYDATVSPDTSIKFMTDGMLSRERLADPLLSRYSVIMLDEAHERTLNTDILMASLKVIQKERRKLHTENVNTNRTSGKGKAREEIGPLKLIIMSATLDAEKFSKFFDGYEAVRNSTLDVAKFFV